MWASVFKEETQIEDGEGGVPRSSHWPRGKGRLRAWFPGEVCHLSALPQVFTRMGQCYTFNSGAEGAELLTTPKGGMGNGLEVLLDVQQDEYLPVWRDTGAGRTGEAGEWQVGCRRPWGEVEVRGGARPVLSRGKWVGLVGHSPEERGLQEGASWDSGSPLPCRGDAI